MQLVISQTDKDYIADIAKINDENARDKFEQLADRERELQELADIYAQKFTDELKLNNASLKAIGFKEKTNSDGEKEEISIINFQNLF